MDYSYMHDRQATPSGQEMSQGHPQNQFPFSSSQQQPFPLASLQSQAYPVVRFAPFLNPPLQGPVSSQSHVPGHQDGMLQPQISVPECTTTTTSNADNFPTIHRGPELSGIPCTPGRDGNSLPHSDQVSSSRQQAAALDHQPAMVQRQSLNTSPDAPHASVHTASSTPTNPVGNVVNVSSGFTGASSSGQQPKRRRPAVGGDLLQPQILQENVLKVQKGCQTEPLFEAFATSVEVVPRAALKLSDGVDYVEKIDQDGNTCMGVFATKDFREGEEFGPFTGEFVANGLGYLSLTAWELCVKGSISYISGTSDPKNWMAHVQVARCKEEQNLEAFQFYGNIFFRTTKNVKCGTELRVFYGKDYSKHVGFKRSLDDLHLDKDSGTFKCQDCSCRYTNPKSLMRHLKFEHDKENVPSAEAKCEGAETSEGFRTTPRSSKTTETPLEEGVQLGKEEGTLTGSACHEPENVNSSESVGSDAVLKKPKTSSTSRRKLQETQKLFICKKCGKHFQSEGPLREHAAFHKELKETKPVCCECGLECPSQKALRLHKLTHNPDSFHCHLCKMSYRLRKYFVIHLRKGHDYSEEDARNHVKSLMNQSTKMENNVAGENVCEICDIQFKDSESLKNHASVHKSSSYHCSYCKKKFKRKVDFVEHLTEDHDVGEKVMPSKVSRKRQISNLIIPLDHQEKEEPFHEVLAQDLLGKRMRTSSSSVFKCKFCPKRYSRLVHLMNHEKLVHKKSGKYQCEFCQISCKCEIDYILHRRKHTKERPFKCPDCPGSFATESALQNHQAVHNEKSCVTCDQCGKGFGNKKNMISHKSRVHATKTRQCTFCDKFFRSNTDLRRHVARHKGIRPFVCVECGRAFGSKHELQVHIHAHTGEKPFECKFCQKRFSLSHHLSRHLIFHQQSEDPETFNAVLQSGSNAPNGNPSEENDD